MTRRLTRTLTSLLALTLLLLGINQATQAWVHHRRESRLREVELALAWRDHEWVLSLVAGGMSPNLRLTGGGTLLEQAILERDENFAVALLEAGADPNLTISWEGDYSPPAALTPGMRVAVTATQEPIGSSSMNSSPSLAPIQLHRSASPDQLEGAKVALGKNTPLHEAVGWDLRRVVRKLLERGANVNARDEYGRTALFLANNVEPARLLLAAGADPNLRDVEGRTAIQRMKRAGNHMLATWLHKEMTRQ